MSKSASNSSLTPTSPSADTAASVTSSNDGAKYEAASAHAETGQELSATTSASDATQSQTVAAPAAPAAAPTHTTSLDEDGKCFSSFRSQSIQSVIILQIIPS
jgi:hypothetical protein